MRYVATYQWQLVSISENTHAPHTCAHTHIHIYHIPIHTHTCTHTYTYPHTYTHPTYPHTHIPTHTYPHTHIPTHNISTHTHTHIPTHNISTHTHTHIPTHNISTHTHTQYIHTYPHTHTHTPSHTHIPPHTHTYPHTSGWWFPWPRCSLGGREKKTSKPQSTHTCDPASIPRSVYADNCLINGDFGIMAALHVRSCRDVCPAVGGVAVGGAEPHTEREV